MRGQSVIILPSYKIPLYSDYHLHQNSEHTAPWPGSVTM